MFKPASLLYVYSALLVLGPIIYIGKLPLASYHLIFLVMLSCVSLIHLKNKSTRIYLPTHFRCYLTLLSLYFVTYIFNFFEKGYIADFRDLIIIFAPVQYIILIYLVFWACKYSFKQLGNNNLFFYRIIKLNLYLLPIVGLIALCQMLDLFGSQEILAKYYGKTNVAIWRQYFMYNPRASSTINLEPNSLALYATISLVMFHVFYKDLKLGRLAGAVIYFLGLLTLMLSGSFTGLIIYLLVSWIYFFKYKKIGLKAVIFMAIITFIVGVVFSDNIESAVKRQKLDQGNLVPSSFNARINNAWSKAYISFENEFVNGIGPSALQLDYSADNDFLDKFLRFGLIGGLANVFFILFLISYPLVKRRNVSDLFIRKLYFYSFILACCFALASITGSAFKAKRLAELFWIFYSLPFIYTYLLNKPKAVNNEK
ncbi:O-antigen ligase family protein [Pseudoalteromonas prydzensis]|uniref:O-antigen ligase family protein n=1 Tax=Pseudoalteromonas prydzensis TaxID=182141 RepID=UPI0007E50339|nr:hypothetical protein [Pseudoalteromonas prydzensis]MBE0376712.1 hypothetical protein [Pseudoalteromonas prydzensis ACAM 620]